MAKGIPAQSVILAIPLLNSVAHKHAWFTPREVWQAQLAFFLFAPKRASFPRLQFPRCTDMEHHCCRGLFFVQLGGEIAPFRHLGCDSQNVTLMHNMLGLNTIPSLQRVALEAVEPTFSCFLFLFGPFQSFPGEGARATQTHSLRAVLADMRSRLPVKKELPTW